MEAINGILLTPTTFCNIFLFLLAVDRVWVRDRVLHSHRPHVSWGSWKIPHWHVIMHAFEKRTYCINRDSLATSISAVESEFSTMESRQNVTIIEKRDRTEAGDHLPSVLLPLSYSLKIEISLCGIRYTDTYYCCHQLLISWHLWIISLGRETELHACWSKPAKDRKSTFR